MLDFAGKCFAPYLKKEDVEKLGTNLDITFTSDLQGKILEVYFAYPDRIQLPLETIEQLETYILTKCSLRFKPNDMLKEAKFVFFNCSLSFKAIYQAIHGLPSGVETSTPDGYKKTNLFIVSIWIGQHQILHKWDFLRAGLIELRNLMKKLMRISIM